MTRHRIILAAALFAALLPGTAQAAGQLIKGSTPAVYYVDEGKRYVFPNEKVYFTWYQGFDGVTTVSDETLASYPIGGNVTYKPGLKLVKIQSDPRVYAVGAGGTLRWVTSEQAAIALYGSGWNRQVDDIPDAFFFTYKEGEPVASAGDFDRASELTVPTIADDLALRSGGTVSKEFNAVRAGAWSDPATWGGAARPGTGAQVRIPAGVKVMYDMENAPSLKTLEIFGTLEFSQDRSVRLAARQITVRGALNLGTPEAPWPAGKTAEIFLTGAASTGVGDDGLTVDGGTLSLHGASVGKGWAALASPADEGDAKIALDAPVAWPVGSEIAILGATYADAHETRVITAVDGAALTLDAPLAHAHRSEPGLRTEVLLLGRNVAVRGTGDGFGSYVRGINRAKIDVTNAAFEKLGRKGVFGQHPLLLDGLSAPRFSENVIRASGNRCVVLRQTISAKIEGNVAFGVYGHCFTTEDGAETDNAFAGNVIADVRAGALAGDGAPAGFLLRHPGNALRGNHVVASAGFGYWYLLPENATKNSGTLLKPREAALLAFDDNAVRGARHAGLYVDDGQGKMNYIPDDTAVFSGLHAVMNGEHGFWMRGAGLEVRGAYLAENAVGGAFAAFVGTLKDSVIEGWLQGSEASEEPRVGFTYLDGPVSLLDVTFRRFDGASSALAFAEGEQRIPDPRNSFRRVTFEDARPWSPTTPVTANAKMSVVRDNDAGDSVVAPSAFLGDCPEDAETGVTRCDADYAQVVLALRESPGDKNVTFTNLATNGSVTLVPGPSFDGEYAYANVAEGGAYRAAIPNVPSVRVEYDGFTQPLLMRLPAGLGASVRSGGTAVEKKELAEIAPGSWAYDGTKAEAVLWLNPGDAFELIR